MNYFLGRLATSSNLPTFICEDAKTNPGDGKFPVIVGEWRTRPLSSIRSTCADEI
jgi:hypothetical protein